MSGTYSSNSINQRENFSGGVSQIPSIKRWNPKQLTLQTHSQTSTGLSPTISFFDRESGKNFVIQSISFDLMMSDSSLFFQTEWNRLAPTKLIAVLKCLVYLQSLPEAALEEAADELEKIADFYSNRFPEPNLPTIPASTIKGKLKAAQVRPPIVLEP